DESPPRSKKLSSTRTPGNCSKRCQMGVSTSIIAEVGLCFTLILVGWNREEGVALAVLGLRVQVGGRPSNLVRAAHISFAEATETFVLELKLVRRTRSRV